MTVKKIPTINKPKAPTDGGENRWLGAKKFATEGSETLSEAETVQPEAKQPVVEKKQPKKTGRPLKIEKTAETTRENFDLDPELRKEMLIFLATSRQFRTKRSFLTQCLIDGLEKYKGQ